jgi:hypothetical protein
MELSFLAVYDVDFISFVEFEGSSFFYERQYLSWTPSFKFFTMSRMISCMGIETVFMGLNILNTVFLSMTNKMQRCIILLIIVNAVTASRNSKQAWQIPDAAYTYLSSWWWAEKPLETCRALAIIRSIIQRCILLVMLKNTLKIHGPTNVKFWIPVGLIGYSFFCGL